MHWLQSLNLRYNLLTSIPNEIAHLTNLKELDLSINQLTILPDAIAQLTKIQTLDLSENNLTAVPEIIANLNKLQWLNLSVNLLTTVPDWLIRLPNLKTLYLHFNPIISPPPEVLSLKNYQPVDLETLRGYFNQIAQVGKGFLFEAKLLIVGEPGAGKTSLARKLRDPEALLPTPAETTKGIDVYTWTFSVPVNHELLSPNHEKFWITDHQIPNADYRFRVNVWDFGGQEIYAATHQFFLTRRSLYVVVADAREQKTDFFDWLNSIEHLSDASPVLILSNEKEDRQWAINETELRGHFGDLKESVFAANLLTTRGLERLREAIQYHITHLPHIGDELPKTWVNVRRALENDLRPYISQEQFLELCGQHSFTRHEDKLQLSGYLHDLGVILHFQDDPLLKHTVILQPEWGTDAVYRVLDNKDVQNNRGHFTRGDLDRIWHEDRYVPMHDELLALMMKFQLCYEIPAQPGTYIAPQLLSEQPRRYPWRSENNLNLRFKYDAFMPRGIITRFIVALHHNIAGQKLMWRNGVVLLKDKTAAEVMELRQRKEIRIRVAGAQKRDLLTIIVHELDKLHRPFHRLTVARLIPCNCPTCRSARAPYFFRLDILKTRLAHGRETIECDQPPFHKANIRSLIDDVGIQVFSGMDRVETFDWLLAHYDVEELKTLCFRLGLAADELPGEGRSTTARELIQYMERRGRLMELVELARGIRP
ncbi:MAG: hypothetical protein GY796_05130 [Chloroflexi bacterium]|nr:hypothetical protein [Chloroflexota bacterium]